MTKKKKIISILLFCLLCFNLTLRTSAFESMSDEDWGSGSEISICATGDGIEGISTLYYYVDENGNTVSFRLRFRAQTGLIFTPNGTDASDFTLTGNNYYTLTFLDELPEGYKR